MLFNGYSINNYLIINSYYTFEWGSLTGSAINEKHNGSKNSSGISSEFYSRTFYF